MELLFPPAIPAPSVVENLRNLLARYLLLLRPLSLTRALLRKIASSLSLPFEDILALPYTPPPFWCPQLAQGGQLQNERGDTLDHQRHQAHRAEGSHRRDEDGVGDEAACARAGAPLSTCIWRPMCVGECACVCVRAWKRMRVRKPYELVSKSLSLEYNCRLSRSVAARFQSPRGPPTLQWQSATICLDLQISAPPSGVRNGAGGAMRRARILGLGVGAGGAMRR
eukprot:934959-Pleurochrysis_carterae.AAC.1